MEVAQEEIFGPVLSVIHADSLDQAIEIVNGSRYGHPSLTAHCPIGGWKAPFAAPSLELPNKGFVKQPR